MLVMAAKLELELLVTAFLLGFVHSQTTDASLVVDHDSGVTTGVPLPLYPSLTPEVQSGTTRRQTYNLTSLTEALQRTTTRGTPTPSTSPEAEDGTSQPAPPQILTTIVSGVATTAAETDLDGSSLVPPVTGNPVSTDSERASSVPPVTGRAVTTDVDYLLRTTVASVVLEENITSEDLYNENITRSSEKPLTEVTVTVENTTAPVEISFASTQPYLKTYTLDSLESSPSYTEATEITTSRLHESNRHPPAPSTPHTTEHTPLLGMSTQTDTTSQEVRTEGLSTSDVPETVAVPVPVTEEHTMIPDISVTADKDTTPSDGSECTSDIDCVQNAECKTVNGRHVCVCKTGFADDTWTGECVVRTTPVLVTSSDMLFSRTAHSTEKTTAVSYSIAPTGSEAEIVLDVSPESSTEIQETTIRDEIRTPSPPSEPADKITQARYTTLLPDGDKTTSISPPLLSTTSEEDITWEYSKPADQLSMRESAGSVSVVFLAGIGALQWVTDVDALFRKALADILNNKTQEMSAAAVTTSEKNTYLPVYPRDVVYIEPFPHYKNSEVVVSFFVKRRTIIDQEEIWPRHVVIAALRGKKHWIQEQIRWNITAVFGGIPSYEVEPTKSGFFYPHLDLLIVIILVTLAVLCLISLALVCSWCRSTQKARWDPPAGYTHYDRTKLAMDMPYQYPDLGQDLASDEQCQEGEEKPSQHSSFVNGNNTHIIKKNQNEGWVVPFEDVPTQDHKKTVQDVEDTKL